MAEETKAGPAGDALAGPAAEPAPGGKAAPGRADILAGVDADDEIGREVGLVVRTMLEQMGIRCRVRVEKSGDEYYANIRPQVSKGLLIGRKGTTLRAIQYLTRLIVKRKHPEVPSVMVDVGGYRLRRESFLCKKAEAVARIVMETKREMALDPLTEKERAMVEDHLKPFTAVRVYAVMAGSRQNVIIAPK